MARAALDWSQTDLEQQSQVSRKTIADFEAKKRAPLRATLFQLRRTLEEAGVIFIPADEHGGPGVRLRKSG